MNQKLLKLARAAQVACVLGASGCGADVELPPGWEDAERVEHLTQMPCEASAVGWEVLSEIHVDAHAGGIGVEYDNALFRCKQDVEAFQRRDHAHIDVLIQPVDMHPNPPVRCDCLYRIEMDVPAPAGAYSFTLYTRGDDVSGANSPVDVGHSDISVR